MSLQDVDCRHASPKTKPYKLFDTKKLYLMVTPQGRKYWRMNYRFFGKEKTLALGIYPQCTLAKARSLRDEALTQLTNGIDPILAKQEDKLLAQYKSAQTVELVFREWHKQFTDTWTPKTAHTILRRLEAYIFPHLGEMPIEKVTPPMLLTCLQKVEKISRDVAERLLKHCYRAFIYANNTGRPNSDPTKGLIYSLKRYKRGHLAAIDINELPSLLNIINSEDRKIHHQTYLAMRLLMLTAVRTNELIKMKWPEIHFDLAQWIIPGERMKMKQDHIVPLSRQVLEILQQLKEMNGHREWVLPSKQHYKRHMSDATFIRALERMQYKGKMTGHGFRTVFLGVSKEKLNYPHDIPDRQLAHTPKGTNGKAYDRASLLPQRTKLMQDYADYIDKISKPNQQIRSNDEQSTRPTYTYTATSNYSANWSEGVSISSQRYQYINIQQQNNFGSDTKTEEKRAFECMDTRAGEKLH